MSDAVDHSAPLPLRMRIRQGRIVTFVNTFFFLFAGVASVWLVVLAATDTRKVHWLLVVYLVLLWATMAYIFLPRLYKLMTAIFIPDYFIGRARTSEGILGDVINMAWDGPDQNIHQVMQAAGWKLSEPITLASSLGIIKSVLAHTPYPEAPVSPLYLFGHKQDFAYQKDVDGSADRRHHIRFWKCPNDWPLPGGRTVDWLAAAAFDKGVRLSAFTLQVTHSISGDIDAERDYTIKSVEQIDPTLKVSWIQKFSTAFHARNGGGDMVQTDGDLPIVDVNTVPASVPKLTAAELAKARIVDPPAPKTNRELLKQNPPPKSLYLALVLAALGVVSSGWAMIHGDVIPNWAHAVALVLLVVGMAALFYGVSFARMALMLLYGLDVLARFIAWFQTDFAVTTNGLFHIAAAVLMLLILSSDPVTTYTRTITDWRTVHAQRRRRSRRQSRSAR